MNSNVHSRSLENRNILITGAAGRLGSIAAKACANEGATVILLDKTLPGLEAVYDAIVDSGAPQPAIYPLDLAGATEHHYTELADILNREFGILHGLLHNAADFALLGPVADIDTTSWSRVLHVNLDAPYLLTRVLLPIMQKARDASIVFTSDSAARKGRAYWGVYSVSKIAVEGFARILSDELESAAIVRVNVLVPGPVDSPLRKQAYPLENRDNLLAAESLGNLYIHLFASSSIGITGQIFHTEDFIEQILCTN